MKTGLAWKATLKRAFASRAIVPRLARNSASRLLPSGDVQPHGEDVRDTVPLG